MCAPGARLDSREHVKNVAETEREKVDANWLSERCAFVNANVNGNSQFGFGASSINRCMCLRQNENCENSRFNLICVMSYVHIVIW